MTSPAEAPTRAAASAPRTDPVRIAALMGAAAWRFDIDAVAECDSTNAVLLAAAAVPSGRVLVADRQRAGRGRRGRRWISDPDSGLTFSLFWRFARPPAAMAGLSLAVGLAIVRGLAGFNSRLALKWPNDLLARRGDDWTKVGGILVELAGNAAGSEAVIGIGINLAAPRAVIDAVPATALPAGGLAADGGPTPDRHAVLAACLADLAPVLERFEHEGFAPFAEAWERHHAYAGRPVRLEDAGEIRAEGRCAGIAADGSLLLDENGRVSTWATGDLGLRPA